MIIKSTNITTSSKSGKIVHHLIGKVDENDSIEILWGSRADVDDAFTNAELSNKKYGVKHFIISNLEEMTDEQMLEAIDEVGKEFGFTRKNVKMAVIHGKDHHHADGRHLHFLVETVNPENNKNFDFKNYQQRQELVSRKMELDNGFQLNKGRHNRYVFSRLEQENPEYAERMKHLTEGRLERKTISEKGIEKLRRRGLNPFEIRKELKEIWKETQDYNEFKEHLKDKGYTIEQGRKTLIINDQNGNFITGVKNVLSVNDKELSEIINQSEKHENKTASHGYEGPKDASSPLEGITNVTPLNATEQAQEQHQEQTTQPQQTSPQPTEIGSNTETTNEVKAETSEGMTAEEKLAINEFNKEQNEKEKLLKESLANQTKRAKEMLENMQIKKEPKLQPSWTDILDDKEKLLTDIIDQPHPKLKSLTQKDTRNFLYKNFKDELDQFYNDRKELCELRKDIRELRKHDKWYNILDKRNLSKKEKMEEEERKKLVLLSMYIVHMMMHKLRLTKNKPNSINYMTDQQKKESQLKFKENRYAQLLYNNTDRSKCLDAISTLKIYDQDGKIEEWKNRDEVRNAKLALSKLNDIRDINVLTLDEKGQKEFKLAQESLDIDKARKAILEAHKREENRYLLDLRPEQEHEQNQDNEQERSNSNVIEFPKNSNQKKKKSFSLGR